MARSSIVTAVSLDQFAFIMGIHPALFNSIAGETLSRFGNTSRGTFFQYNFQNHDQLSRHEISLALLKAEQEISRHLGYLPRPEFLSNEVVWSPPLFKESDYGESPFGTDERGIGNNRHNTHLQWGEVVDGGVETYTAIDDDVTTVAYSDRDGDGQDEWFSISLTGVTVTDPTEVSLYFHADDRMGMDIDETWRIRPVYVELDADAGTLTISGHKWQLVKPALHERLLQTEQSGLAPDNVGNFVTKLAVYRRWLDTTQSHVTFYVENPRQTQTGYLVPFDRSSVVLYPGEYSNGQWNEGDFSISGHLSRAIVSYQAGKSTNTHGDVDTELASVISRFAVGFMTPSLGDLTPAEKNWAFYAEDLVNTSNRMIGYRPEEFENPLGTWRGAIEAWRYVKIHKVKDYE